ncbi:uncharacterized protein KGF55_002538 [Candida pseudojiufengensis]|uniref:uncharacterized protein n=1 Tax=Candida pseudojiufengensis TaxID=497109 RepID=UPI00222580D0|nr:uncharacterized protein KGF55_002538 [Candida pseudojiufengensis]KAI5963658.1 hypothetical protein KGF55_002538 [Candida pseudojiufengensis]
MSNILEKSLDDIIGEKQTQRKFVPTRRRGTPSNRSSRFQPHSRYSRFSSRPNHIEKDRDVYIPRTTTTTANNIPKDVLQLAKGRPTLRLKNIHQELNGEDLNNLFSSINSVDFIKFDDLNDSIAYICFQNDNDRSNKEAIEKYDGKKAMGKILIVENTVSLVDRIKSNPVNTFRPSPLRSVPRGAIRGGFRGGSRGSSRGGFRSSRSISTPKKSAEDLDKELDNYMTNTNDEMSVD